MRKKFIGVYALMAVLALGTTVTSCVDDNESASVTAIRNAKAEQLNQLAALSKAQASYQDALTAYQQAVTDTMKAYGEYQKGELTAKLEYLKAEYEKKIVEAEKDRLEAEKNLANNLKDYQNALYSNYSDAMKEVRDLNQKIANKTYAIARAENNLADVKVIAAQEVAEKKNEIAAKTAEIEAYKAWGENSFEELQAKIATLSKEIEKLSYDQSLASGEELNAQAKFNDAKRIVNPNLESELKSVVALYELNDLLFGLSDYYYGKIYEKTEKEVHDVVAEAAEDGSAYITVYSLKDSEVTKYRQLLKDNVNTATTQLGKSDDAPAQYGSGWARYNYYKKDYDDKKAAYEADKTAANEQSMNNALSAFQAQSELSSTYVNNGICSTKADFEDALNKDKEKFAKFEANVTLLTADNADYKAYLAKVDEILKVEGLAWDKAGEKLNEIAKAYNEKVAERGALNRLVAGTPDIESLIAQAEKELAELNNDIVTLNEIEQIIDSTDGNVAAQEATITYLKAAKASLEEKLKYAEQLASLRKAELEAAIAGDAAPETPAE